METFSIKQIRQFLKTLKCPEHIKDNCRVVNLETVTSDSIRKANGIEHPNQTKIEFNGKESK